MSHVEFLSEGETLLALVVRADFSAEGIHFFTGPESSQQLGYMKRPAGYEVVPHWHKSISREVNRTQEVLLIRSGRCQLDLYGSRDFVIASVELFTGDVVLLAEGGHGLKMVEETEIVEVKQGPYSPNDDKVRFVPSRTPA